MIVDPDGTVTVSITEDLRHGGLPEMLAKLYRGDLNVRSTEKWRPADDGRVTGEISVAVAGAPGSGRGEAVLAPSGDGSQLTLSGTVEFKSRWSAARSRAMSRASSPTGSGEIQRFTTRWITEHD